MDEISLEMLKKTLDQQFLIYMGFIILLMQCGFAFLEAGAVRAKNVTNILMKNILDSVIGGLVYWACGFAIAFGDRSNSFFGYDNFFLAGISQDNYAFFFFHFVFAATAATIVSGAMAERTQFIAYFIYSIVLSGLIYPMVVHWAWSETGWLGNNPVWEDIAYLDFAGSGVVHMVGGSAGFVGAWALGPRRDQVIAGRSVRISGHHAPMMALGAFILFFGFFAFNGGSQASITVRGDGAVIGRATVNTLLSGASAGLSCMLCMYKGSKKYNLGAIINGVLAGMVAICAGCNVFQPVGAIVTGLTAGTVYFSYSTAIFKLGVDDPLDAVAVHFGGGSWGIISVTLFSEEVGLFYKLSATSLQHLMWNCIGGLAITTWTCGLCLPLFLALDFVNGLRVSDRVEKLGLDTMEHRESAYPAEAFASTQFYYSMLQSIANVSESLKNSELDVSETTNLDSPIETPPTEKNTQLNLVPIRKTFQEEVQVQAHVPCSSSSHGLVKRNISRETIEEEEEEEDS